jgi:hypothetical protein
MFLIRGRRAEILGGTGVVRSLPEFEHSSAIFPFRFTILEK